MCDYVQLGESGPGAYIFCATSLTQLGPHPKVLFYFFGGGFIGNLFSGDISFITSWAQAFPDVIIVCPQYDIAPEPYPVALNQCVAAYMAVMKHGILGCMPSSCVISGQSAGGMLAASLCVRLAQKGGRGGGGAKEWAGKAQYQGNGWGRQNIVQSGFRFLPSIEISPPPPYRISGRSQGFGDVVSDAERESGALAVSRALCERCASAPWIDVCRRRQLRPRRTRMQMTRAARPCLRRDETLARFPQTYIIAAGLDPLLDDSVDFPYAALSESFAGQAQDLEGSDAWVYEHGRGERGRRPRRRRRPWKCCVRRCMNKLERIKKL